MSTPESASQLEVIKHRLNTLGVNLSEVEKFCENSAADASLAEITNFFIDFTRKVQDLKQEVYDKINDVKYDAGQPR